MAVAAETFTEIQPHVQQKEPGIDIPESSARFNPYHALTLVPHFEKQCPGLPAAEKEKRVKDNLRALFLSQLKDALREMMHVRLHEHVMFIEQAPDGTIALRHPHYPHGDLVYQCEQGVKHAITEDMKQRYALEKAQVEMLQGLLQKEIVESTPHAVLQILQEQSAEWVPYEGKLPEEIARSRSAHTQENTLAGPKYFFVMPSNRAVYPDGSSYWNVWQPLYVPWLPENRQHVLLIHQYFNFLTNEDHARALDMLYPNANIQANEHGLMDAVVKTEKALQPLGIQEFFTDLLTRTCSPEEAVNMLVANQVLAAEFEERAARQDFLPAMAEYLTNVVYSEHASAGKFRGTDRQTAQYVLAHANEVVLNTLIQNKSFDGKVAYEVYTKKFNPKHRRPITSKESYEQTRNQYLASVATASPSMSHILNRAISIADCSTGAFGGLTRLTEMANNAQFMQGVGLPGMNSAELLGAIRDRGHVFTKDQIARLIGKQRFEQNFKAGQCVACGNMDFVGECGVCWRCELTWEKNNAANGVQTTTQAGEFSDSDTTPFSQFGRIGVSEFVQSISLPLPRIVASV